MENQKKVWDAIAPEWNEYKKIGSQSTIEFLDEQRGKVLDLGSGSGRHLQKIKSGKMYLVDFSDAMIELAKKKSKKEKIDAEFAVSETDSIPYDDDFFDGAICVSVLHCVKTKLKRVK